MHEITITLPPLRLGAHVIEPVEAIALANVYPGEPDVGVAGPYCEVVDLRSLSGRPLNRLIARAARSVPDFWSQLDERATEQWEG